MRTFLGAVHTAATAKYKGEVGKLALINDTQRILVESGELLGLTADSFYTKRYKVTLSEASEENLMTALNNTIEGIKKLNRRETISEYTRPAVLCHIKVAYGNSAKKNMKSTRWSIEIYLDVEWSTS